MDFICSSLAKVCQVWSPARPRISRQEPRQKARRKQHPHQTRLSQSREPAQSKAISSFLSSTCCKPRPLTVDVPCWLAARSILDLGVGIGRFGFFSLLPGLGLQSWQGGFNRPLRRCGYVKSASEAESVLWRQYRPCSGWSKKKTVLRRVGYRPSSAWGAKPGAKKT